MVVSLITMRCLDGWRMLCSNGWMCPCRRLSAQVLCDILSDPLQAHKVCWDVFKLQAWWSFNNPIGECNKVDWFYLRHMLRWRFERKLKDGGWLASLSNFSFLHIALMLSSWVSQGRKLKFFREWRLDFISSLRTLTESCGIVILRKISWSIDWI